MLLPYAVAALVAKEMSCRWHTLALLPLPPISTTGTPAPACRRTDSNLSDLSVASSSMREDAAGAAPSQQTMEARRTPYESE